MSDETFMSRINPVDEIQVQVKRVLQEVVSTYETSSPSDINSFIAQLLTTSGAYPDAETAQTAAWEIGRTIDRSSAALRELQAHVRDGGSRQSWFTEQLASLIKDAGLHGPQVLEGVKQGLGEALHGLSGVPVDVPVRLSTPLDSLVFEDLYRNHISENLLSDLRNSTLLGAVYIPSDDAKADAEHPPLNAAVEFFESELGSPAEVPFKKVLAAGVAILAERGWVKPLQGHSPSDLALIVDRGLTTAKVAYKIVTGEMQVVDAIDHLFDHAAAVAATAAAKAVEQAGGNVGAAVGASLGAVFGPGGAALGATFGRAAGQMAGRAVAPLVQKGVAMLAEGAKTVAREVGERFATAVSNAGSRVLSLFGF